MAEHEPCDEGVRVSGALAELVKRTGVAVVDLTKALEEFTRSSNRYSKRLLVLTWVIAALTLVMTVLARIMAAPIIRGWISAMISTRPGP